ncbi:class I SAM-dependent methyltransferase, partial [Microlunatus capsulatus]|uniref:class I SAM-dependent methyltransferase n=1 Tax=Microlunatus capsulatus TaxID=99117 RepID=UPI0031D2DD5C
MTAAPGDAPPLDRPRGPVRGFTDIPGWFYWLDYLLFRALLRSQAASPPGVLVEIGAYLGKSAVVIGEHVRPGEELVVVDLFGRTDLLPGSAVADANRAEVDGSYRTLTRQTFEQNYRALHPQLPTVVEGLSETVVDHVAPGTARFVHVDASHLFDVVRADIARTRELLRPGGVVVLDDWRSEHTPGVAAAVWEAVLTGGLVPVALTPHKFYGVYDDPAPARRVVEDLVAGDADLRSATQSIAGHEVLRLRRLGAKPAPAGPRLDVRDLDRLADRVGP